MTAWAFAGIALAAGCAASAIEWTHPPDEDRTVAVVEDAASLACPAAFRTELAALFERARWRVAWIDSADEAGRLGAQRLLRVRGVDAGALPIRDVTRFIITRGVFVDRSAQLIDVSGGRVLWQRDWHEEREVPDDPARPGGAQAFAAALRELTQASCEQVIAALRGSAGLAPY